MDIREAFQEYRELGVGTQQWEAWAALFADDAEYWERGYSYHFTSGAQIGEWIPREMTEYSFISLWMDWAIFDGDKACLYLWNNLPTPEGSVGQHFGFPNSSFLQYDEGTGRWSAEWDHYNQADGGENFTRWMKAGGHPKGAVANWELTGVQGWQPEVPTAAHSRDEVESAVATWNAAAAKAWNGEPGDWLSTMSSDAVMRDHGIGACKGMRTPHEFWSETAGRVGTEGAEHVDIAMPWSVIEGNRVGVFFTVTGAGGTTDGCTILHYAGDGKFNYQEDVYNPAGLKTILQG